MMEEKIKSDFQISDSTKEKKESDKSVAFIFIPLLIIVIFSFKFSFLRIIVLCISIFVMTFSSYKTFQLNKYRIKKGLISELVVIVFTGLAFFLKLFSDLVLSFMGLLFFYLLVMFVFGILNDEKMKLRISYYVFLGSIVTAILLNYEQLSELVKRLINK